MILILKPGKPLEEPSSYHPISLLPIISKVFEKAVCKRLMKVIIEKNVIPAIQFGFRAKHSTIEQVHRAVNTITQALEKKQFAPAVFLDVSCAFDRVWHEGLIIKLRAYLPSSLCNLLISYLKHHTFRVQWGCGSSQDTAIAAGVPQGSVLGPILFLLFTSDFPVTE
ncbi:unnamed protein product, partial [Allacma fusca]